MEHGLMDVIAFHKRINMFPQRETGEPGHLSFRRDSSLKVLKLYRD
jgi:hypothetical protein